MYASKIAKEAVATMFMLPLDVDSVISCGLLLLLLPVVEPVEVAVLLPLAELPELAVVEVFPVTGTPAAVCPVTGTPAAV